MESEIYIQPNNSTTLKKARIICFVFRHARDFKGESAFLLSMIRMIH